MSLPIPTRITRLIETMRLSLAHAGVLLLVCGCTGEFATDATRLRAAENAHNAERLVKSLNEIKAWHEANRTGVAGQLRPARNLLSIDADFSEIDCAPTDELKSLWSWHDGGVSAVPFIWYHDFLPLEDALSEYKRLLLNPLVQWDPRYIPIFEFEGDWYAAYCGTGAGTAGPIVHYSLEDEPRVVYVNLAVFMASMSEMLRSGAVAWKNDAMVDNIRKVHEIHQKHNRGYEFPYYVPDGN